VEVQRANTNNARRPYFSIQHN